jgi:hypothetical protein
MDAIWMMSGTSFLAVGFGCWFVAVVGAWACARHEATAASR